MIVIGIATTGDRGVQLAQALESLQGQADEIHVYDNSQLIDLADNAKFYFQRKNIYYLTCDDDIIYPPTYVKDIVRAVDKYKCIVTHHGRRLKMKDVSYYRGHEVFDFDREIMEAQEIDVPGTGVMAYRTDYFMPDIAQAKLKRMSDLIFALAAAQAKRKIMVLPHEQGYLRQIPISASRTISGTAPKREHTQIRIANSIFDLRCKC